MTGPVTVMIANERGDDGQIHDRTFRDVVIEGPAVLLIHGILKFDGCSFPKNALDMLILVQPGGSQLGVVGIHNCSFIGCRFVDIGIAAMAEIYEEMRDQFIAGGAIRTGDDEDAK